MTDQELRDLVAENSKAIKEMRESQKKTDEMQKKTDEMQKKTDEQIKNSSEEWNKGMQELRESQKKTDEQINKLQKLYGSSENNKGLEVEEYFYRYFLSNRKMGNIKFDRIDRNIISSNGQEHDIVLINGKSSALISVKSKFLRQNLKN